MKRQSEIHQVKRDRLPRARVNLPRCMGLGAVIMALATSLPANSSAQTVSVSGASGTVLVTRPEGYIGIVYSGDQRIQRSQRRQNDKVVERKVLFSYGAYPVIVSVEPGSPAERAGLLAGDTVLSYNGKDVVSEPFPLHDMLKPGAPLKMRVRRSGAVRTVNVTVGRHPSTVAAAPLGFGTLYVSSPEVEAQVRREVERAHEQVRRELEKNRDLTESQREQIRRTAERSARATAVRTVPLTFTTASFGGVAGAEMAPLNEDLSDLVGVRRGVFVVKVNPGTPADQSGLKGGDVITAVGDSAVADVAQLRRAISVEQRRVREEKRERAITVHIVRKHRRQKVTLKY